MRNLTSKRSSKRHHRTRTRAWFLAGLASFVLAAVAASIGLAWRQSRLAAEDAEAVAAMPPVEETSPFEGVVPVLDPVRPVYPYSIIDGGARSVSELEAAIKSDPLVAAHYRDFDLSRTRVERLAEPRLAHVSYRVGNDIFWTRKKIQIPRGETVLTDGEHTARTRCGNQVADVPLGPVAPAAMEPAATVMDRPVVPTPQPAVAAGAQIAAAPVAGGAPGGSRAGGLGPAGMSGSGGGGGGAPLLPAGSHAIRPDAAESPLSQAAVSGAADSGRSGGAIPPARSPEGVPTPPNGPLPPGISLPSGVPSVGPPVPPEIPVSPFTPSGLDQPTNPIKPSGLDQPTNPFVPAGLDTPSSPIAPTPSIDAGDPSGEDPNQPVPVPEPGSMALMVTAALGYAARHIRAARAGR